MTFSVQFNPSVSSFTVNHTMESEAVSNFAAQNTSKTSSETAPAYVTDITTQATEASLDTLADAPLTDAEIEQLFSAYALLGQENNLWENIGNVLGEVTGSDRTNFLAALSSSGNDIEKFVLQVEGLEADDRTLYLKTALRAGKEGLSNLIEATGHLSPGQLTNFLETADTLGRSIESIKANELGNFLSAVAQSPQWTDDMIQTAMDLNEEDRALFLEAAEGAKKELGRLIETVNNLPASDLTLFLKTATEAGKGLSNLITLTQETKGLARHSFLAFTENLESEDTENFLLATQGNREKLDAVMSATSSLNGDERSVFLSLAAEAGTDLNQLILVVDSMSEDSSLRSDFLTTAFKVENLLDDVLTIAEDLSGQELSKVFAFSSDLALADLTSFVSAAASDTRQAYDIAETADNLEGKAKSHFLYAASKNPDAVSELITLTQELKGVERSSFLYTSANLGHTSSEDMNEFLTEVSQLTGTEREVFIAQEKLAIAGTLDEDPATEYVHLRSIFDDDQFELLMGIGDNIDQVMADYEAMDASQRQTYLDVAAKAGPENLQQLMSVLGKLDDDRRIDFVDYAHTLGKENFTNLIKAADTALKNPAKGLTVYDNLMETLEDLDPAVDEDFLNAAAKSGKNLEKFIDMTDRLEGFLKTDFLIAADNMADRSNAEQLLDNFLRATEHVLEISANKYPKNPDGSNPKPSQIIDGTTFKGSFGLIEGFLKSTAWLGGVGISDSHMNEWLNTWQGIPRQSNTL